MAERVLSKPNLIVRYASNCLTIRLHFTFHCCRKEKSILKYGIIRMEMMARSEKNAIGRFHSMHCVVTVRFLFGFPSIEQVS